MKKGNITLIGMPGVGKSTVGVVLAKVLGLRFVDSDLVIQEQEGRLLHEIIREEGLDGFKEIENRVNAGLRPEHTVIATGGSVIYGEEAMKHLKSISTVVYLELDFSEIERRLSNLRKRGVALKEGQTLKELYLERVPLYEKYADVKVRMDGASVGESVSAVVSALKNGETPL